jgi:hypothetical protein
MKIAATRESALSNPRQHRPSNLPREFEENQRNGAVGSILVSEIPDGLRLKRAA